MRSVAVRALTSRGYEVLEASDGREALDVMAANKVRIDIVVSDVVMPEMDGPTLLTKVREKMPTLKVIFVSGYAGVLRRSRTGVLHAVAQTQDRLFRPRRA